MARVIATGGPWRSVRDCSRHELQTPNYGFLQSGEQWQNGLIGLHYARDMVLVIGRGTRDMECIHVIKFAITPAPLVLGLQGACAFVVVGSSTCHIAW